MTTGMNGFDATALIDLASAVFCALVYIYLSNYILYIYISKFVGIHTNMSV